MKTMFSLSMAAVFLLLLACSKDLVNDDKGILKKSSTHIPVKADFCASPAPDATPILIQGLDPANPQSYLPDKLLVAGTCTHMGPVQQENSWSKFTVCKFILENQKPFVLQEGVGFMTADNGDGYNITFKCKMSLLTSEYTGEVIMDGGTGRFDGVAGLVTMSGKVDPASGSNCWQGIGEMWYPK